MKSGNFWNQNVLKEDGKVSKIRKYEVSNIDFSKDFGKMPKLRISKSPIDILIRAN